ncbi:MAG TPA: hypothetical protein VIG30_15815, partial [Ktedonobacterales bacterium]
QLAERCWRAYLDLTPPDDAGRLGAQNNLGTALGDQAGLATDDAERRRLLGAAETAYRAAIGASVEGTADWAIMQYNLAVFYWTRAEGAEDETAACADLGEALGCADRARGAFSPGTADHADAVALRLRIEEAQRKRGCP